jgi:hypothetical protein
MACEGVAQLGNPNDCCEQDGCACADNYNTPGTGGAGRPCPFTDGDDLVIADGVLTIADRTITYTGGPDNVIDTVTVTVVIQPTTSSGPASLTVRIAITGALYVYARVEVSGDIVILSLGSSQGQLAEQEIDTAGIDDPLTLEACFKPPVVLQEDVLTAIAIRGYRGGATPAFLDNPESVLLDKDNVTGSAGSLGEGDTFSIGAEFFRPIPDDAEVSGFAVSVTWAEAAAPGNGIFDSSAVLTYGGHVMEDQAHFDALPEVTLGDFGYGGWDDLWGETSIDVAEMNQQGITFGVSFTSPIGPGGGTQVDSDSILLGLYYYQDITQPGRLSARVTSPTMSGCLSVAIKGTVFGGGVTGITAVGEWEIDNYTRTCDQSACAFCLPPVDCVSSCCNENDGTDFEAQMLVEGFDDTEILPDTLDNVPAYDADSYVITNLMSPNAPYNSCLWAGGNEHSHYLTTDSGTVVQDPSDPDNNVTSGWPRNVPIIGISATIFIDFDAEQEGGISCFWQVSVSYRFVPIDDSLDTGYIGAAIYRALITPNDPPDDLAGNCASAMPITVIKHYEPDLTDMPGVGNTLPDGYEQWILPELLDLDWIV